MPKNKLYRPSWRELPPTKKQLEVLARFDLSDYSRGDASDKIRRLAGDDWKSPQPAKFEPHEFPPPVMGLEERCGDAKKRGLE